METVVIEAQETMSLVETIWARRKGVFFDEMHNSMEKNKKNFINFVFPIKLTLIFNKFNASTKFVRFDGQIFSRQNL